MNNSHTFNLNNDGVCAAISVSWLFNGLHDGRSLDNPESVGSAAHLQQLQLYFDNNGGQSGRFSMDERVERFLINTVGLEQNGESERFPLTRSDLQQFVQREYPGPWPCLIMTIGNSDGHAVALYIGETTYFLDPNWGCYYMNESMLYHDWTAWMVEEGQHHHHHTVRMYGVREPLRRRGRWDGRGRRI